LRIRDLSKGDQQPHRAASSATGNSTTIPLIEESPRAGQHDRSMYAATLMPVEAGAVTLTAGVTGRRAVIVVSPGAACGIAPAARHWCDSALVPSRRMGEIGHDYRFCVASVNKFSIKRLCRASSIFEISIAITTWVADSLMISGFTLIGGRLSLVWSGIVRPQPNEARNRLRPADAAEC
jgi:hypothetical protein